MFHLASALFWTLIQPVNLAILLMAGTLLAIILRWRRLAILSCLLALAVVGLSGWTTLGALLLHPLENRFEKPQQLPETIHGIVVLGGGFEGSVNLARGGYELNDSGDRFVEAAILARRFPEARIVVSGGSGSVFLEGEGDADTAPRLLAALGVPVDRIEREYRSRDTYENALFSYELVMPKEGENWLLVTSAFHMPRAVGVFRQVNFPVLPWPVDYKTAGSECFGLAADNVTDSLGNTSLAIREWLGLLAYKVAGRTDRLLPGATTRK